MKIYILALCLLFFYSSYAQDPPVRTVATDLDTVWEIVYGPDNFLWVTERFGRISRINPQTGEKFTLITIQEVHEEGESGLLGMTLHPNFQQNPFVYVYYTYRPLTNIIGKVVRYTYNGTTLSLPFTLLDNIPGASIHNGARLAISKDLKLFITTGDANNTTLPQNDNSLAGKVLRINLDGTIPLDNPIPGNRMWTKGHRNPQGLVIAEINGQEVIYISEHGPSTDDEINIIEKGRNYGWPTVNGFCDQPSEMAFCAANNVKEPLVAYTPTLAVAGITYIGFFPITTNNDKENSTFFDPLSLQNSIILTTLKESDIRVIRLSADGKSVQSQQTLFDNTYGRLRSTAVPPNSPNFYFGTSNKDGRGTIRSGDDKILQINSVFTSLFSRLAKPVRIYPNPVAPDKDITVEISTNQTYDYAIFDISGKIVLDGTLKKGENAINIKTLNTGFYSLILKGSEGLYASKFVIE